MNTEIYDGWTTNLVKKYDGYESLPHKIGTPEDITTQNIQNTTGQFLSRMTHVLENIFNSQALGKDIISIPISDAFKEGRTIKNEFISKDDNKSKFDSFYIELHNKMKFGIEMAGVYGGSYIVISSKNQMFKDELVLGKDSIDNISILNPTQLHQNGISGDPLSKNYMKPEYYYALDSGTDIHPSRVFYIDGEACTDSVREQNQGLGLSKYERIAGNIQNLSVANNRGLNILAKMHQDVIAIDGMNQALKTADGTDKLRSRLVILNQLKSVLSTLAIDKEDTYTNVSRSLAGVKEIIELQMMMISSASRIPITKLFGTSASGMNATGEGDLKNYYDDVWSNIIKARVAPIYAFLDPIVTKHLFDTDEVIDYEFIPLYTLNEIEIANIAKTEAETHNIYKDMGVVTERDVLLDLQKQGKYEDVEQGEHGDEFDKDEDESTYPKNKE